MTRDLMVGLFFLLALFIFGAMTFMKKGNPFAEKYQYTVRFDDVGGLKKGEQVRVRGHAVGKVGDFTIVDGGINVAIILETKLPPRQGYSFAVASASTLGGKYVKYNPGDGELVSRAEFYQGEGSSSELFESIGGFIEENRESVRQVISNLEDITDQANDGKGLLGLLLRDQDLADNAKGVVASLRRIIEHVEGGEGVLGALLYDRRLAQGVERTLTNVEEISYKINSGDGTLGMLINDTEISSGLRRTVRRIEDIVTNLQTGDGLVPRLLSDGQLADRFSSFVDNLEDLSADLRSGQGLLPRLLNDPAFAQTFDETLVGINQLTERINNAQGTLGLLIASDSLYRDIEGVVRSIREAAEDAREQAPINTFVNVLFSAF